MAAGMAPRVLPLPRQQSFGPPPVPNPFVHLGRFRASDMLRVPDISDSIIPCKGQSAMGVGSGLPGLFASIAGTGYAVTADMSVLQGIILIPLRAICLIFLLLLAWLFASIVTFCQPGRGSVPLKGWRRRMIQVTLSGLTRTAFFVLGFQVKVKGKVASLQEAPIFVAAPHSSFFDAIICALTGMPSIVSRAENLSTPVFGTILSSLQPVAVSRQDSDSRKKTVTEITKRALSRGQWPQILIFPEGTCTNRSCLITFKQGAFVSRVPVQPVLLRYPNKLDTVTWTWQGYSFKVLCLLTMCQLITRVEVEFLPVHVPTEEEKNDPVLFAYKVRQTMATALNVPVTDHTFEDCRLMISAGQLTLPMEAGLVEFTKISKKLNLKWNHVREQLNSFAAIASASKGGRIGIEEFADYLKLPITDVLKQLFGLFDRGDKDLSVDALLTIPEASVTRAYHRIPLLGILHVLQCKQHIVLQVLTNRRFSLIVGAYGVASLFPIKNEDGTIDFREYVIGLSILCNPANTKETIDMAFRLFDMDDDGTITEHEFASIIQSALGVPDLDVSMLFREIDSNGTGKVSYDDFKTFAQKHPEYAKLFTTYLDLQRQQADISDEQDMEPPKVKHSPVRSTAPVSEITPIARNKVCPESNGEDSSSTSDKKDD